MDQYQRDNSPAQCWPTKIRITLQIIFLCKVVHGIWVNIAQVTFLCNAGTCRLRQRCIGSFPAKTCLYSLGQHCTNNYLVQCCLRRVWTTLTGQYSYAMLFQHGRYNIAQVIFVIKVVCLPQANIAQVIFLCNFDPEMIDPLAAGKEFLFEFSRTFFVWKQRLGMCFLLILHKQIYLNIIKWFISISTLFLRNQSVVSISEEFFEKNISRKYPLDFNFKLSLFTMCSFLQVTVKCDFKIILFYKIFKFFEQHYINSFHIRIGFFHSASIWQLLV